MNVDTAYSAYSADSDMGGNGVFIWGEKGEIIMTPWKVIFEGTGAEEVELLASV